MIVVHISEGYEVYGGRPRGYPRIKPQDCKPGVDRGWLGNSAKIEGPGKLARAKALADFRVEFYERVTTDPAYKMAVLALKGKRVGCHCHPLSCHLDIVADFVNDYRQGEIP